MGKATLYHPVSLHVIRGAAEYCGWKFGKIKQTSYDPDEQWARYAAVIQIIPERLKNATPVVRLNDLRDCFARDIEAHWLRQTKSGVWTVDIITRVISDNEATNE